MSRFDLRDISDRLSRSRDTEAVVFEFLGFLQAMRHDWRAGLAFHDASQDRLVYTYERQGSRLVRRDLALPVSQLPTRLVRKFFHPSAFFNQADRRTLIGQLFSGAPYFEPELADAAALRLLTPQPNWQSCVCLPLADHEGVIALLVLTSEKHNAFGAQILGELIPVKNMAALAILQHFYRSASGHETAGHGDPARVTATELNDRIHRLNHESSELEQDNRAKGLKVDALMREMEMLDKNSSHYKQELERLQGLLGALEQQTAHATQELSEAYSQLNVSQARSAEIQRTLVFMKGVADALGQRHDPQEFASNVVTWFCEHFGVERCSLMLLDPSGETLQIAAQRGMDASLAPHIKVRVGQGVSGWVAHHRKPLFVRAKQDASGAGRSGREDYNSDSFISAPLVYNNRVWGVLNLSNKTDGQLFDDADLDRAQLAGAMAAVVLGTTDGSRRSVSYNGAMGGGVTVRG